MAVFFTYCLYDFRLFLLKFEGRNKIPIFTLKGNVMRENVIFYVFTIIIQCSWGCIQTIIGAVVFLLNFRNNKHFFYKGVVVTMWDKKAGCSLGLFIFVPPEPRFYNSKKYNYSIEELQERLMIHEFGHSIQSLILGPLYFVVIGVVSALWSIILKNKKKHKDVSYFDCYTEKWANQLGELVSGKKSMERIDI